VNVIEHAGERHFQSRLRISAAAGRWSAVDGLVHGCSYAAAVTRNSPIEFQMRSKYGERSQRVHRIHSNKAWS
jgi:hypothetical protein